MRRRTVPDNLGPLVDTLANVVGILVIVLALTQIELGGALDRVLELERARAKDEEAFAASLPERRQRLDEKRTPLAERGATPDAEGAALADEILEVLAELEAASAVPLGEIEARGEDLAALRRANADAERALEDRRARAASMRSVPRERVARLPDPRTEHGRESWILVRHGRIYPVDRKGLFDDGSRALRRLLNPADNGGGFRPDEFKSAALYLRKRTVGRGGFRWQLETEPQLRVRLEWPDADRGIEPRMLARSARWRQWLAAREPGRDFVRFRVWNDSFEAYGLAREAVEAAGLGAGWTGYAEDEELEVPLSFGTRPPEERDIEVD